MKSFDNKGKCGHHSREDWNEVMFTNTLNRAYDLKLRHLINRNNVIHAFVFI
jgi:hypothetical protein